MKEALEKAFPYMEQLYIVLENLENRSFKTNAFYPISKEEIISYLKNVVPREEGYLLEDNFVVHNMVMIYNYLLEKGISLHIIYRQIYLLSLYGRVWLNTELKELKDSLYVGCPGGTSARKRMVCNFYHIYSSMYKSNIELCHKNHTVKEWLDFSDMYLDEFYAGKSVGKLQRDLLKKDLFTIKKIHEYYLVYILKTQYFEYIDCDIFTFSKVEEKIESKNILTYDDTLIIEDFKKDYPEYSEYIEYNFWISNLMKIYQYYEANGYSKEDILKKITFNNLCGDLTVEQEKDLGKLNFRVTCKSTSKKMLFYKRLREKFLNFYIVGNKCDLFSFLIPVFTLEDICYRDKDILMYFSKSGKLTDAQLSLLSIDFELIKEMILYMDDSKHYQKKS